MVGGGGISNLSYIPDMYLNKIRPVVAIPVNHRKVTCPLKYDLFSKY